MNLKLIVEFLANIAYLILATRTTEFVRGENNQVCIEKITNNLLTADCSNLNIDINIPQVLNKDIQVLNLSFNSLNYVDAESFSIYFNLLELDMKNMSRKNFSAVFDYNSFIKLNKLKYLDVSYSCHNDDTFAWPNSLEILKMENCPLYTEDLKSLKYLKELHAAYSSSSNFPEFNPSAPLVYLDLRGCPMYSCPLESLAPFCRLTRLVLEILPKDGLQNYINYCQCLKVNEWLQSTFVEAEEINCTVPYTAYSCDSGKEDEEAVRLRRECLAQASMPINSIISKIFFAFLMVAIMLFFSASIFAIQQTLLRPIYTTEN